MALGSPGLGENGLSKVVELGICSQLDKVEDIGVDIRTNPGKLVQGRLDSVSISNPLRGVFGNLELKHKTDAEAEIILTEDDLNRAFSSDFIQKKFYGIKMDIEGKLMTVDVHKASIHLPGDNEFILNADFLWRESGELKKLSATAIPEIEENGYKLYLHILSAEGQGLKEGPVTAMFEQLTNLLDLRNFNIPGMSLQFRKLDAQQGRLLIHAKTQIQKIPSA